MEVSWGCGSMVFREDAIAAGSEAPLHDSRRTMAIVVNGPNTHPDEPGSLRCRRGVTERGHEERELSVEAFQRMRGERRGRKMGGELRVCFGAE